MTAEDDLRRAADALLAYTDAGVVREDALRDRLNGLRAALAARAEPPTYRAYVDTFDGRVELAPSTARSEPRAEGLHPSPTDDPDYFPSTEYERGYADGRAATPPAEGPTHYPHCNDRCIHYMEGSVSSRFSLDVAQREPGGAEPRQGAVTEPSTPPAEGLDVLVAAVRDWMQFGAGDGTTDAEAESERLLRNIAKAYAAVAPEQP